MKRRCRIIFSMDAEFDLDTERAHAERVWSGSADSYVPLSVAAAVAFHRVHGNTRAIATRQDYDDALNIAATALARLIPIHAQQDAREGRQQVPIDLARQSFARGATRLVAHDGTSLRGLSVRRAELLTALAQLRSSQLPLFVRMALSPKGNRLLAALPPQDYLKIAPHLELVPLRQKELIYTEGAELRHVLFPVSGVVSLLYITHDGEPTEIAVIGNEGVIGLALLLGAGSVPRRAVVQIAGQAYRIAAPTILAEFRRGGALQEAMLRYVQALMCQMAQTAVCNRHHTVEQQLCRWLLLSLDRIPYNHVDMTQELISNMLGVRRAGITEAARTLQKLGLIRYTRGRITVPNRHKLEQHACECYGVVKKETDRLLPPQRPAGALSS